MANKPAQDRNAKWIAASSTIFILKKPSTDNLDTVSTGPIHLLFEHFLPLSPNFEFCLSLLLFSWKLPTLWVKNSSAHANPTHMYTQSTFLSLLLRFARKSNSHVHTDEAKTHMYTQVISHSHANLTHMCTQMISHVHTNDLVLYHHYKMNHGETNLLLQSLATLLMGGMVGWDGLGQ